MRTLAAGVLVLALLACGCSEGPQEAEEPPRSSAPTLDPTWGDTMTVEPATARPGQRVALHFTPPVMRGIAFSLAAWSEGEWSVAYYLASDWGSPRAHEPDWWSAEDSEGRGWVDVGIAGPGPDHVVVPDSAPAGDYLLCTANAAEESCAMVTVVAVAS